MNSVTGINASNPLANIFASEVITPSTALRASGLSLSSEILFDNSSTTVELSELGRLLSAATRFQEHLLALKPGSATSGGGKNYGTDFASLAAEVQSFVDAFNGLQNTISDVGATNILSGGSTTVVQDLRQALDAQAQADYANDSSALTKLSQLGITFHPPTLPGGGGKLSIDLDALQSAFDTDASGAFSLLSEAANAFGELGGNFAKQGTRQYSSLASLAQFSSSMTLFGDVFFTPAQSRDNIGLFDNLLLAEALTSGTSIRQAVRAISQYTLVANLFG